MYGFKIEIIKAIGNIIVCMEKEKLHGLMEGVIKDNINMIKSMVLVHFSGRMAENILDIGKMENNMGEDNIIFQMAKRR